MKDYPKGAIVQLRVDRGDGGAQTWVLAEVVKSTAKEVTLRAQWKNSVTGEPTTKWRVPSHVVPERIQPYTPPA